MTCNLNLRKLTVEKYSDNTTHSEVLTNKNAKLQKKLHELKVDQKLTDQSFHDSILSFIGYIAAGG